MQFSLQDFFAEVISKEIHVLVSFLKAIWPISILDLCNSADTSSTLTRVTALHCVGNTEQRYPGTALTVFYFQAVSNICSVF